MSNWDQPLRFNHIEANTRLGGPRKPSQECEAKLKRARLVVALCVSIVSFLIASAMCYGQCPLHVPTQCKQLVKEREELSAEQKELQADMKDAVGQQKSAIAGQIKSLSAKIAAKQQQMESCAASSGVDDVQATLTGKIFLEMHSDYDTLVNGQRLFIHPTDTVHIPLTYKRWTHDQFVVNRLPQLLYKFGHSVGVLYAADPPDAKFSDCGSLNKATGKLSVTITILMSFDMREGVRGPYVVSATLSTGNGGALSSEGNVLLEGDGIIQDGPFKGEHCKVSVSGIVQPLP
jgi:hypothetical protein